MVLLYYDHAADIIEELSSLCLKQFLSITITTCRFMGCAALDTRVPRVRALERYIEDIYSGPHSNSIAATYDLRLSVLLLFWCVLQWH